MASPPGLLEQLRRSARFQWIFIGLETPSKEALTESLKEQNNRADAMTTLRSVYAHGMDVYASFVVGFDADDATIFDRQYEFIVRRASWSRSSACCSRCPARHSLIGLAARGV